VRFALLALLTTCTGSSEIWRPHPGTSWQWQLSGALDTSLDVAMYDVDLFVTSDEAMQQLRARGVRVVCYFSAGTYEPNRPDTKALPIAALGKALPDWPQERWLDIRSEGVRALVRKRLDYAAARGCDGVEPDNVDAYANDSGFPLSASDQIAFNRFIASEAHTRKLSVGLKNDLGQIAQLVTSFDWALDEQCMEFDECDELAPFIKAQKPVFHVEYGDESLRDGVCTSANGRNFDTLIKHLALDAFRISCR
jgi:hypothetical protein